MVTCSAHFTLNGQKFYGIPVLNPGEWFGKAFLIETPYGQYVVESDNESDAVDEFVDRDPGRQLVIAEEDLSDYDEDELHYAGSDCEPVCLDYVAIYPIPPETLRYDDITPSEIW